MVEFLEIIQSYLFCIGTEHGNEGIYS